MQFSEYYRYKIIVAFMPSGMLSWKLCLKESASLIIFQIGSRKRLLISFVFG